jgi:hypothetical protein
LQGQIREVIENRTQQQQESDSKMKRKMTREEMNKRIVDGNKQMQKHMYSDFQKIVLDFQLQEHERFLKKFNLNFKRFDLDCDGLLNEDEFKHLVLSMGVLKDESEIEPLLH